jgi:hypothetical protein
MCARVNDRRRMQLRKWPALRPRALPLNLQLRQERNQGMRAHLHDRGKVELDERLALIGRELEFVGEGRRIG